jgi:hypothetical protein
MYNEQKDFAGKNGFTWWIGVVEDRMDPIRLGRCRVRCIGWHSSNKMDLPTDMLPWAMPSIPVNSTNVYPPKEGSMVFGFFLDGENAQEPVMLGSFPNIPLKEPNSQDAFDDPRTIADRLYAPRKPNQKIYNGDGTGVQIIEKDFAPANPSIMDEPTTPRMARNDAESINDSFIQDRIDSTVQGVPTVGASWDEPFTQYGTQYPYNNVMETESGHVMEFDDTFGRERIQIAHRSGSFQEMFPNGDKVEKITKDNYEIVLGDDHVLIMGKCQITVQGDAEILVQKSASVVVDQYATVAVGAFATVAVGGYAGVTVGGYADVKVGLDTKITTGGDTTVTTGGDTTIITGGDATITSGRDIRIVAAGDLTAEIAGGMAFACAGDCEIASGGPMTFLAPTISLN